MLNSIIPSVFKKWPRNGKSQVFKKLCHWLLTSCGFWILWISILKILLVSSKIWNLASSLILQIVNFVVLLFWNLCVLENLQHCFLHLKRHLKTVKNYNHCCCLYHCYYKWHFYHYSRIVHYRWINWITWTYTHCIFPFPFDCKSSYGRTKIISTNLSSPRTQTHT